MALRRTVLTLVVTGLFVTACGGDDDEGISLDEPIGAPGSSSTSVDTDDPSSPPSVVKEAFVELDVVSDDLDSAAQRVVDLATGPKVGGYLVSSVVDTGEGYGSGNVVVRVPAPLFEQVVRHLNGIGDVTLQRLNGDDVTPEYIATQNDLREARGRVAGLLDRLEEANNAGLEFRLREELQSSRSELRELERSSASIEEETSFSSIDVVLNGVAPPAVADKPAFARAVTTSKDILWTIASGAVLAAGVIVPIGLLLLVAYLIVGPVVRRLRPRLGG